MNNLNELETKALEAAKPGIEQAYTTDEITEMVAESLGISINSAKGYLGQLCLKGYLGKGYYYDGTGRNRRKITQFELMNPY